MSPLERAHRVALVGLALMLGLFEGPAEIMCVLVLVTTALTGRLRGLSPTHPLVLGLVIWALAGVPGVLTADVRVSSQGYLRPLHALAVFVGGLALRDVEDEVLAKMAWAFGGGIVLNGAYGLLQVGVGALPLDDVLLAKKSSPQIFVPGTRDVRCSSGLFYNRIRLAHVGALGLGLLAVVVTSPARRLARAAAALGFAVLGLSILLTYARMVVAAWAIAAVLLVLVTAKPRRALFVAGAFCTLAIAVAAVPAGRARLAKTFEDLSIRGRIFSMATEIFSAHPWFGVGHGAYTQHARLLLRPGWSRNWTVDAHNLYLHTLAESGVFGAIGFLVAVAVGVLPLLRAARASMSDDSPQSRLHRFALFVLLTFLVLGVLHQPLHHASVGLGFWFAVGVGAFSRRAAGRATGRGPRAAIGQRRWCWPRGPSS